MHLISLGVLGVVLFFSAQHAESMDYTASLHRQVTKLEDKTSEANLMINSMPGEDERQINEFAIKSSYKRAFFIRQGAIVYIVNPRKISGFLWWKKVKITPIKAKVFDGFIEKPESSFEYTKIIEDALGQL